MLYPKFPRRTLALILFCMVITLGAVGSIFIIYFFNENSTPLFDAPLMKSVYVDDKPNQQYRQNLLDKNEYKSDQELLSIYSNYVENDQVRIENSSNSILKASQEFEANRRKQAVSPPKSINSKGQKDNAYASSDTIYIDDFDRPTYSSKRRGELGNIDYFDTILVDHKIVGSGAKNQVEKLSNEHLEEAAPSIIYKTRIISESSNSVSEEDEFKPRINNKRRWDENQLMKLRKDDDVYDSEIETAGSGSGDFFDDTEVNEVFIRQLNSRANKKEKYSRNSLKMNNKMRRRKKHRVFIRVGDKFISSSQTLSTMPSAADDTRSGNWGYQRNLKKLSSYPTNPTIHFSQSLPALKKLPIPAMFTNSASNSPTSPYNDNFQSQLEFSEVGTTSTVKNPENPLSNNLRDINVGSPVGGGGVENNEAWIETRTRRIMGNVKKSEERSRQLLLCEEAGGGELCRMLFKGHIND